MVTTESTTKTSQYFKKDISYSEETYHYYEKIKLLVILKSPATTIGKVNLLFRIVRPTLLERGNLYTELSGRHYEKGVIFIQNCPAATMRKELSLYVYMLLSPAATI